MLWIILNSLFRFTRFSPVPLLTQHTLLMWRSEYKRNACWTGTAAMWHFYQTARAASNGNINHFLGETHCIRWSRCANVTLRTTVTNVEQISERVCAFQQNWISVLWLPLCVLFQSQTLFGCQESDRAWGTVSQWMHFSIKHSGLWQERLPLFYELHPALIEPPTSVWKDAAPTIYSQSPTKHSVCLWGSTTGLIFSGRSSSPWLS